MINLAIQIINQMSQPYPIVVRLSKEDSLKFLDMVRDGNIKFEKVFTKDGMQIWIDQAVADPLYALLSKFTEGVE